MANEKRLIDADAGSCGETAKIKTHHARIVVDGTAEKPYYSIEWYDPTEKEYFLGYSSYYIENVFSWLSECFEIVNAPTVDAMEVEKYIELREQYDKVFTAFHELRDDFISYVCDGVPNPSPYCKNKCPGCCDSYGWCKHNDKCQGFNPAEVILDGERKTDV